MKDMLEENIWNKMNQRPFTETKRERENPAARDFNFLTVPGYE